MDPSALSIAEQRRILMTGVEEVVPEGDAGKRRFARLRVE